MSYLHLPKVEDINLHVVNLIDDKIYARAVQFSIGAQKQKLEEILENANRKYLIKCVTVCLKNELQKKQKLEIQERLQAEQKRDEARWQGEDRKADERARELAKERNRRSQGLCPYCGGIFKGLLFKKCSQCGKPKDY